MGLDMYFTAKRFLWREEDSELKRSIAAAVDLPDTIKVNEVCAEFGYWRKANAIHQWFVANVQEGKDECQESYVGTDMIEKLLLTCRQVKENPSLAPALLPTQSGFFFGGTEYDEWYMADIEYTILTLELALKLKEEHPNTWDFYYRSSW